MSKGILHLSFNRIARAPAFSYSCYIDQLSYVGSWVEVPTIIKILGNPPRERLI